MTASQGVLLKAGLDGPESLGHVERHSPGLCCVVSVSLRTLRMANGPNPVLLVWFAI